MTTHYTVVHTCYLHDNGEKHGEEHERYGERQVLPIHDRVDGVITLRSRATQ